MDTSLDSILSNEAPTTTEATPQPQAETPTPEVVNEEQGATGDEVPGSPPEQAKDDPLEKHRKGLEAAAAAERKKRQDAEARAEAAERRARELETLQQQRQQPPPQQTQTDDPKPLRSQFETEDEWLDARDAWRDRSREREAEARKAKEQQEALYAKTEGIYAQAQALEGFDRAAFDRLPLTKPIVEALIESEQAPKLMHYMASNPAEVVRIAGLSATKQYQELARIEDKLNAAPKAEESEEDDEAKAKPKLPQTLTQARNAKGRFEPAYSGPTPLNAILATK